MKPEARVLEITSLTKKISFNYHFNEFFELKYIFLASGIRMCHLLAAYWNLSPTCCMLATDNTEFHLDMHTTVLNCEF